MFIKNNYSSSIGSVFINHLHVGTGYFLDSTSFMSSGHFLFNDPEQYFIDHDSDLHQESSTLTRSEHIQVVMIVFHMLGRQMSVLAKPKYAEWSLISGVNFSVFELIRDLEFVNPMRFGLNHHDSLSVLIRSDDGAQYSSFDLQLREDNSFDIPKDINPRCLNGAPVIDSQGKVLGHCICRRQTNKYARVQFTSDLLSLNTPATSSLTTHIQSHLDDRPFSMI